MEFTWNGFEQGRFVVHCQTEEASLDFIDKCKQRGYRWLSQKELNNNGYKHYQKSVCYQVTREGLMSYASCGFYEEEGRTIVKWELDGDFNLFQVMDIIKKDEIYYCGDKFIKFVDDVVTIGTNTVELSFTWYNRFTKKEQVNFTKAYEYMMAGKTLKCLHNNYYYKIKDNDLYYSNNNTNWTTTWLTLAQIQSNWTVE